MIYVNVKCDQKILIYNSYSSKFYFCTGLFSESFDATWGDTRGVIIQTQVTHGEKSHCLYNLGILFMITLIPERDYVNYYRNIYLYSCWK